MMKVTTFLAALLVVSAAVDTVEVVFLGEAGCPECQAATLGPINALVVAVSDVITLKHHPFGNNYFPTKECGSGPYTADERHCWAKACPSASSPAADCFTGDVVTQHGPNERAVNKMEACAITVTNGTAGWRQYWPFVVCMEKKYENEALEATKACAEATKLDYSALEACYNGPDGVAAEVREAKATFEHAGTPDLFVNGVESSEFSVLRDVCAAYTGPKPAGC